MQLSRVYHNNLPRPESGVWHKGITAITDDLELFFSKSYFYTNEVIRQLAGQIMRKLINNEPNNDT